MHLLSGDLWAGAESQSCELITALHKLPGLEVSVLLFNHGELERRLSSHGVDVTVLDESRQNSIALCWQVKETLRRKGSSILHTHRYKENVLGAWAAKGAGVAHCVKTMHGRSEPFKGLKAAKAGLYGLLDRWATDMYFDRVICVTKDMADELRETFESRKVVYIHNGIDVAACVPRRSRSEVRAELGFSESAPVLIWAGRLVPIKGVPVLLEAARSVSKLNPGLRVLIAGDGPERAHLEEKSRALELAETVKFCGHRQDITDLVAASDALVLPSLGEGLPMIILEAMALGTPIVASNVGGMAEILEDGKSALLVPPNRPEELAAACLRLLRNKEEALALAQQARQIVNERFTVAVQAERMRALYQSLGA